MVLALLGAASCEPSRGDFDRVARHPLRARQALRQGRVVHRAMGRLGLLLQLVGEGRRMTRCSGRRLSAVAPLNG